MSAWVRLGGAALGALVPLGVGGLLTWQAQTLPLSRPLVAPDTRPGTCAAPPLFEVAFPRDGASVSRRGAVQSHVFMGNGWLTAEACRRGTLRVVGDGRVTGGAAPRLEVALNSRVIWSGEFSRRREVQIPVPAAGHLTLGYFNDFYRSEYREALLSRLSFQSASCARVAVEVPPEAGGGWNSATQSGAWIFGTPVVMTPCGAGELRLRLVGRRAGGASPAVRFRQAGQTLRDVQLSGQPQDVTLQLSDAPLEVQILNPYFKELGDRNLALPELEFIPGR